MDLLDCVLMDQQIYAHLILGNFQGWKAVALGKGSKKANEYLKKKFKDDLKTTHVITLALKALQKSLDLKTSRLPVKNRYKNDDDGNSNNSNTNKVKIKNTTRSMPTMTEQNIKIQDYTMEALYISLEKNITNNFDEYEEKKSFIDKEDENAPVKIKFLGIDEIKEYLNKEEISSTIGDNT